MPGIRKPECANRSCGGWVGVEGGGRGYWSQTSRTRRSPKRARENLSSTPRESPESTESNESLESRRGIFIQQNEMVVAFQNDNNKKKEEKERRIAPSPSNYSTKNAENSSHAAPFNFWSRYRNKIPASQTIQRSFVWKTRTPMMLERWPRIYKHPVKAHIRRNILHRLREYFQRLPEHPKRMVPSISSKAVVPNRGLFS